MATWKEDSQVYKTRLYEKYGIIEEKFDKQAFNEDPIGYFESINYNLKGIDWIPAMWNLLKLAHTDSKFIKKQLGPNGQKVSAILCKILLKNKDLGQQVEAKMETTPDYSMADTVLQESNLIKYDRILDGDILNEGKLGDWWRNLSKGKKVGIIVGIIAIILAIAFTIVFKTGYNELQVGEIISRSEELTHTKMGFWDKVKFFADSTDEILKVGLKQVGQNIANTAQNVWNSTGGALINSIKNAPTQKAIASIAQKAAENSEYKSQVLRALEEFYQKEPGTFKVIATGKDAIQNITNMMTGVLKQAVESGFDLATLAV